MEIGQKTNTGATITGIQSIINHGEFFTNTQIVAKVSTKGKRGAKKTYYVKNDGSWVYLGNNGYFEGIQSYNGTTGVKELV